MDELFHRANDFMHEAAGVKRTMNKINLQPALASMDHDEDILYAVVNAFIAEVPTLVEQLEQALAAEDGTAVERCSHTLKGNFRILQLQSQQTFWANIEKMAHQNALNQVSDCLPEAKTVTQDVLAQLKSALEARES